mgnify:FL=1|jgi:hypothetical protein|nr:MAG TPA: hypothetical protein [Caudoviricetes sp.]
MRINVQVIEENIEEKARRALLAKVVKPVRVRDFSYPVDYVPHEAEREIVAERLAEMGLK